MIGQMIFLDNQYGVEGDVLDVQDRSYAVQVDTHKAAIWLQYVDEPPVHCQVGDHEFEAFVLIHSLDAAHGPDGLQGQIVFWLEIV